MSIDMFMCSCGEDCESVVWPDDGAVTGLERSCSELADGKKQTNAQARLTFSLLLQPI
jgi:hypothetical protein